MSKRQYLDRNFSKRKNNNFKIISSVVFLMILIIAFLFIFYNNIQKANASTDPQNNNTSAESQSPKPNASDNKNNNAAEDIKVVIDAGHGGFDIGNESLRGLNDEYILNLAIAKKIGNELIKLGITPIYTRTDNSAIGATKEEDMQKRVDITNSSNAKAFVSIHQNDFHTDSSVKGPEVYYHASSTLRSDKSYSFADSMQKALNTTTGGTRSFRSEDLMVIREANIPAILIECGYMSNSQEEALLNTEDYQNKIAKAIAECIYHFISS